MNKILIVYLVIINILSLTVIYIDKVKARKKKWRVPERNLIGLAILGGSLGTIIGMYSFRHKTKHIKFTLGVPAIILVQFSLLLLYYKAQI